MMQTCRFLYHEGPKVLLKLGANITKKEDIFPFLFFMLAEKGTRCQYLTTLNLAFYDVDEEDYNSLADLDSDVSCSFVDLFRTNTFSSLRTLFIEPGKSVFSELPGLAAAFSALPAIKSITIRECGNLSFKTLKCLRSKIVAADLRYVVYDINSEPPFMDAHPVVVLQESWDTRERLTLEFCETTYSPSLMTHLKVFPNVHTLELGWCNELSLAPFARAFPNLHTLEYDVMADDGDLDEDIIMLIHQERRTNFLRFGILKKTEHASGTLAQLCSSGLACEVVDFHVILREVNTYEALKELVDDVRLKKLSMNTALRGVVDEEKGLSAVFRSRGAEQSCL